MSKICQKCWISSGSTSDRVIDLKKPQTYSVSPVPDTFVILFRESNALLKIFAKPDPVSTGRTVKISQKKWYFRTFPGGATPQVCQKKRNKRKRNTPIPSSLPSTENKTIAFQNIKNSWASIKGEAKRKENLAKLSTWQLLRWWKGRAGMEGEIRLGMCHVSPSLNFLPPTILGCYDILKALTTWAFKLVNRLIRTGRKVLSIN